MSPIKKILIRFIICFLISLVATYFLRMWFSAYTLSSELENSFLSGQTIKLFSTCLNYLLMLTLIPVLIKEKVHKLNLKKGDWWKGLIVFEIMVMVFSYATTPPDLVSTVFVFLLCQPIVLVNTIVLNRELSGNSKD